MGAVCCKAQEIDIANAEITLDHFYISRAIGKGSFGKVSIVRHRLTQREYALKYINKKRCIQRKAVHNIINERNLLEKINYPLIVNLCFAFQDGENLFMALDLMLGGDLRYLLDRSGVLSELQVRFYVAEVALSLGYLHQRRIAHRDIKPENVLLDARGHAHLTDFNVAVTFSDKKPLRWSAGGTVPYMAPEIHGRAGHTTCVDWWSLGIMTYEMLFGERPFKGTCNDQVIHAILNTPLSFPGNVYERVSEDGIDLISKLLQKSPSQRLGSLQELQRHPWFRGLDWDSLEKKTAVPPFIPDSKTSNFDAVHEIEEMLLGDTPLRPARKVQSSGSIKDQRPVTEEAIAQQMMEEQFRPFDYHRRHQGETDKAARSLASLHHTHALRTPFEYKYRAQGYNVVSGDNDNIDDWPTSFERSSSSSTLRNA